MLPRVRRPALLRLRAHRFGPYGRQTVPSFQYKRRELARIRQLALDAGRRDPIWDVNDKLDAHAWAARMGVRSASILQRASSAHVLSWAALPDRFVVKPVRGSSSRGVFLLERSGGILRDVISGAPLSQEEVVVGLDVLADRGVISREVLVERMIEDTRRLGRGPVDWKFTTFFGRVGLVEAKVAGHDGEARWRLFDSSWRDLGAGYRGTQVVDPRIDTPEHADDMMRMAAWISSCVPRPFVRVDLYDDQHGPVFGEITPAPGGPPGFRPDLDQLLGHLWEEAEARLMMRAADTGWLTPASLPLPRSGVGGDAAFAATPRPIDPAGRVDGRGDRVIG